MAMGVSIKPGMMALTRMPYGALWIARDLVSEFMPAFETP